MAGTGRSSRPRVALVVGLACLALSVVGVVLLVTAWRSSGTARPVLAVVGIAVAIGGAWYSGFFHDEDDPNHPLRRLL